MLQEAFGASLVLEVWSGEHHPIDGSEESAHEFQPGFNVFMVRKSDIPNLNQMIDAVVRDGYVICQEYLMEAENGDTRLFLMNGQPLRYKGKYAAYRREREGGDMRSNIQAGGTKAKAEITENELRIAEIVRPKLVQDGMFLAGLDIVGNKLMEINVFSPGGLGSARIFEKVNFCTPSSARSIT